jgi:hypothetical protein
MTKYEQLMQTYEEAAGAFDRTRRGTRANENAGRRLGRACEALEQYRANNKLAESPSLNETLAAMVRAKGY